MCSLPKSVLDEGRKREVEQMLMTPQLQEVRPIYERGFDDGIPPNVKLWELEPAIPDGLGPAERKASIQRDIAWLSQGSYGLNEEQTQALEKAFDAPRGWSLVAGNSKTGKTSLAVVQALIAAWAGHKVLVCSPNEENQEIGHAFEAFMEVLPKERSRKVYWAVHGPQWKANGAKSEFMITKELGPKGLPSLTGLGMVKLLKADIQAMRGSEYQAKKKKRELHCEDPEPESEALRLYRMWKKMEDDASLVEIGHFNALYRKVYTRVVAHSDILITCCDRAGIEDIHPYFKPTMVVIDNCNLASVPEAWLPLLRFSGTRCRTLMGDIFGLPVPVGDQNKPETEVCQTSLMEVLASRGVSVHKLRTQYSVVKCSPMEGMTKQGETCGQDGGLGLAAMEDVQNDSGGFIGRRRPCICGSRKRFKDCCGRGDSDKGKFPSRGL